jgi:hypothetical protein
MSNQPATPLNSDKPEEEPKPATEELTEKDLDKVAAGVTYNLTGVFLKTYTISGGGTGGTVGG